jgi:hypothetical protein
VLIVDTFNVLHCPGVLPARLAGPGVPDLVRLISVSRYASRSITLVCDGGGSGGDSGVRMNRVRILFSGAGREADDLIERLLERYHRGNALEVVSSDRRLRRAARRFRAGWISSEGFLAALAEDERKAIPNRGNVLRGQVPLDRYSVAQWMLEFGIPPPAGRDGTAVRAERVESTPTRARATPTTGLGEALRVSMPTGAGPEAAVPTPSGAASAASGGESEQPGAIAGVDPLLLAALEEWRDRLRLDDLDMQRWLPDASPIRRDP